MVSSASPSVRHSVPVEVHTAGSNRNVWLMGTLWRARPVSGYVAGKRQRGRLMLTERIWSGNSLRNFHYLIACPETGEALAVDPLEWRLCLEAARGRGWRITQIVNTHEHSDHTGGNAGLKAVTGARILAHAGAAARIGGVDRGLAAGD